MIHKPSLGSLDVPHKIWARSVQPFRRLLDTNRQTSILVYKFRPNRTVFNMYAEYTRLQLTFLALVPCSNHFLFTDFQEKKTLDKSVSGTIIPYVTLKWNSTRKPLSVFHTQSRLYNKVVYSRCAALYGKCRLLS